MTTPSAPDGAYYRPGDASSSLPSTSSHIVATTSPRKQTRFPLYMPEHSLPRSKQAQSEDVSHRRSKKPSSPRSSVDKAGRGRVDENTPLLRSRLQASTSRHPPIHEPPPLVQPAQKKPFYRARPLWLVPFAIVAALVRGMTLAPRVQVYTQLSCYALHGRHEYNSTLIPPIHLESIEWDQSSAISLYSSLDPLGPYLFTPPRINPNVSASLPIPEPIENPSSSRHRRNSSHIGDDDSNRDPRRLPTARCLSDSAVQAKAARLQTILTTTMGLLSALTTGWWGHFGERYGRTKVLAVATFGLFWTDLIFILISTPNLPFPLSWFSYTSKSNRAQHLLLLAPLVEGLLGGWSTLQSATSAYISDCTSPGSRAQIFSRFTGVFYLGFSFGPAIAAWLIRHPDLFSSPDPQPGSGLVDLAGKTAKQRETVAAVFWIAVICSFINFLLVLFFFPESLSEEKRERAKRVYEAQHTSSVVTEASPSGYRGKGKQKALDLPVTGVEDVEGVGIGAIVDVDEVCSPTVGSSGPFSRDFSGKGKGREDSADAPVYANESIVMRFLRPLSIFLPVYVDMPTRNGLTVKRRKDYSLTLLAAGLLAWMLSTGVNQIKYLYAGHTYQWGAERLSYYISFTGGARALFLLVLLPFLIATFKSKPKPEPQSNAPGPSNVKGKARAEDYDDEEDADVEANEDHNGKKPAPTRLQLGKAIRFDLRLTRFSLLIDIVGYLLIAVAPSPTLSANAISTEAFPHRKRGQVGPGWTMTMSQSQSLFVFASGLNAFASGMVPAVHSLALCIVQARTLEADFDGIEGYSSEGTRDQSRPSTSEPVDTGTLFGAFAVLQAVGQMILGPMLFGLVYSGTVASHPKTIFIVATALLVFALVLIMIVKNPVGEVRLHRKDKKFRKRMEAGYGAFGVACGPNGAGFRYVGGGKKKARGMNWEREIETRGRSRRSKDLRGGAVAWYEDERDDDDKGGHLVARSA